MRLDYCNTHCTRGIGADGVMATLLRRAEFRCSSYMPLFLFMSSKKLTLPAHTARTTSSLVYETR